MDLLRRPLESALAAAIGMVDQASWRLLPLDGHKHRMHDHRMQRRPGEEVWLVGERRSAGEQKYYVEVSI
jgi:hypothetical protein